MHHGMITVCRGLACRVCILKVSLAALGNMPPPVAHVSDMVLNLPCSKGGAGR